MRVGRDDAPASAWPCHLPLGPHEARDAHGARWQARLAQDVPHAAVHFCDPQRPWQRGMNENTNRLLLQYLPDGTDLSVYSQRDQNRAGHQLITRPRKTLGSRTMAAIFTEGVALTG